MESQEVLQRNLDSLSAEFRYKGNPQKGYSRVKNLVSENKISRLSHLLRFHYPMSVPWTELRIRFQIDELIQFYNILLVGVFSGYIPPKFNENFRLEIKKILGNPYVRRYNEKSYPDEIVRYTLQYVEEEKWFESKESAHEIFNEFIALNRLIKKDNEIQKFLGMLDFVIYRDSGLEELNNIMLSADKLNKIFIKEDHTDIGQAIWGFIKYTSFLSQLKSLLVASKNLPLLQSAMWLFHGYYFDRVNAQMSEFFVRAFRNLEKSLLNYGTFNAINQEILEMKSDDDEFIKENLREQIETSLKQVREDTEFVLNPRWATPLREYFGAKGLIFAY